MEHQFQFNANIFLESFLEEMIKDESSRETIEKIISGEMTGMDAALQLIEEAKCSETEKAKFVDDMMSQAGNYIQVQEAKSINPELAGQDETEVNNEFEKKFNLAEGPSPDDIGNVE